VPDRSTGYRARLAPAGDGAPRRGYAYHLESYREHVRLVYQAFQRDAWPELARAAAQLERVFGWPTGVVEQAARLVILFHDVGKLNRAWQKWVRRYQKAIGRPASPGFYAHTDFDPTSSLHEEEQRALGRKPPHAVEGAVAVAPLLAAAFEDCEPLFDAAFTAIARHHGAFTREYKEYALDPGACAEVAGTLTLLPAALAGDLRAEDLLTSESPARTPIDDLLVNPGRDTEFLAYILLARALRRADQMGTRER
jgi:CRISPR-associated endonuclease/helicase Cas3